MLLRTVNGIGFLFLAVIFGVAAIRSAEAGGIKKGDAVIVTADEAPLKVRRDVVAVVRAGKRLEVREIREPWLWVLVETDEGTKKGWILANKVMRAPASKSERVEATRPTSPTREAPTPRPTPTPTTRTATGAWEHWRGPLANGVLEGGKSLLSGFSQAEVRQIWQAEELPDGWHAGWSSVTVSDGKAFIYANMRGPGDDVILCFDIRDGRTLWKVSFPGRSHNSPCSSTPTIADGKCFVLASNANVYCLNTSDGSVVWKGKSKGNPGQNDCTTIAVVDGVAVLVSGPITGLDARTGEVRWTVEGSFGHHNSAALWQSRGKTYVICNTERGVFCVDPRTGASLWSSRIPGGGWSSAAVSGDLMAVQSSGSSGLSAYQLSAGEPRKLWSVKLTDRGASPVIYKGHVYSIGGRGNGRAVCVEAETGTVKWDQRIPGTEISSPVATDGKIIAVVGTSLFMIEATPDRYNLLGSANLNIETCTSPALVDGRLYVRLKNRAACYDLSAR